VNVSTGFDVDGRSRFPFRVRKTQTLRLNPYIHKVAKMVAQNNGVRRHTGLTHGF